MSLTEETFLSVQYLVIVFKHFINILISYILEVFQNQHEHI